MAHPRRAQHSFGDPEAAHQRDSNPLRRRRHLRQGDRAQQGAELLAENGRPSRVLNGGMGAWSSTYDLVESEFGGATIIQLRRRGKGCLSYVVGAGSSAVVIDPSRELSRYEDAARSHGWTITHVLDTHLHADHLSGVRALASDTGAALWLNPADPFAFEFEPLVDGKTIELAPGIDLRVASVSVPGHTEGSTMYQLGDYAIFTGDTLFLESVGRPDLADEAEGYAHHLFHSLHERVLPLSDDILVFPAHFGPGVEVRAHEYVARDLGSLRHALPALELNEDEFVDGRWPMSKTDRATTVRSSVSTLVRRSLALTTRNSNLDRIAARSLDSGSLASRREGVLQLKVRRILPSRQRIHSRSVLRTNCNLTITVTKLHMAARN